MAKRKIIRIDEAKCNGCGECVPNCHEGAIQVIDGKARLVSDSFCDGLGACLGHCPEGAISIEEREALEYVPTLPGRQAGSHGHNSFGSAQEAKAALGGCPAHKVMDFRKDAAESQLRQWPIQIMLVPASAPYLNNADLLIAADCLPFAYADFHQDLLKGKTLLVGCPKLDDAQIYQEKFNQMLKNNNIKSITYAHMEVPCCFGLVGVIQNAISASGKEVPFKEVIISIRGERIK